MVETTKARYMSLPKRMRSRHKDGTHWILCVKDGRTCWVQVIWKS